MKTVLEVNGLKKDFDNFRLDNVRFSLRSGRITGFIGINGSGKTTTIKSILGLVLKDAGIIKLFGKEINKKNERELKNRIGIVLDDGYFYEDLTVKEMKNVIASAYSNWDELVFKRNIERFEIQLNQKISTLSKGMKMKYSIAIALSHHADLLIMDEPTSGLDPLVRSELMNILLEFMREDGRSVFFSSHITSDLDKVADDLILIHNGEIVFSEEKNILLDTYALVKGDKKLINENTRKLFLTLNETDNSFEGITNKKTIVSQQMNDVLIERPTIENIMLSHIKR